MSGIGWTTSRISTGAVCAESIRAGFAEIMRGQFDPQYMIDKMVEVIGADGGSYHTVWPPETEALIKRVQHDAWTRPLSIED